MKSFETINKVDNVFNSSKFNVSINNTSQRNFFVLNSGLLFAKERPSFTITKCDMRTITQCIMS